MLDVGRVGAAGAGGRGAVYASFLTTLVIGPVIEKVEPTVPDCKKKRKVSFYKEHSVLLVEVLSLLTESFCIKGKFKRK